MMTSPDIRIKQIIQSLPDAIVVADYQGLVKFLNPAAETLLSYTSSEAIDQKLSDIVCLVDEVTEEAIACIGMKAMISGQDESAGSNALLIGHDGVSELPVEVIARPLSAQGKINGVLIAIHDVRLARFSRKQLSWNASHDALTGIYNRFEFDRHCNALLLTAKRDVTTHALLLVDIDHFRQLNEFAGSTLADELLIQVAQLLKSLLRATDHLSRNGADQFLILLSHCQLATAQKIAENLRQQIENITLDIGHGQWPVTVSIGITQLTSDSPDSLIHLLHEAESAAFSSKQSGRNTVTVFNNQAYHNYNHELVALQTAIQNNDFKLYYQVIESTTGRAPLCEILLRRIDSDGVEHEPASFIPLCERSGLIISLDLWVVRNVLEQLMSYPALMEHFGQIHINLSAYSFASQAFLTEVEALIANYALPHGLICFEVSEKSIMNNLSHTETVMRVLSALGCLFAVDDLNANLSSFERLSKLPISIAKIDGALIHAIASSQYNAILVKAIHEMANAANMLTIAQQVEDFLIYEWLQQHHIDFVQGFILHAPKPIETLID